MMADWFAAPHTLGPSWRPAVDVIVEVTLLFLLAMATHAILGRRHALIRSALWNAVLVASILQPAVTLGLPRLRIACLPAPEVAPGTLVPVERPGHRLPQVAGIPETPSV